MQYWTYGQIKFKIENDLGLEQEDFISSQEMINYCNEAIDDAETNIHGIYEDYFLTKATIDLVQGQSDYELPSNIFANKIRHIMYSKSNNDYYTLRRIRSNERFVDIHVTNTNDGQAEYRYIITNEGPLTGPKIHIVPPPRESISSGLIVWYIRNANTIVDETSVCDIPEFASYIIQHMKVRVYEKYGDPRYNLAKVHLLELKEDMLGILGNMVDDGDNTVEKDLTFYSEMV